MNTIFEFTDRTSVYSKCIFASICHAVMVGKYTLLSDEISWDGTSFLFQNMEGTRGVIYDRNGEVLATNKLAYSVQIEDNGSYEDTKQKNTCCHCRNGS